MIYLDLTLNDLSRVAMSRVADRIKHEGSLSRSERRDTHESTIVYME